MKMRNDKAKANLVPFSMRGNFKSVDSELMYNPTEVLKGRIPTDINGTFLKNGPNLKTKTAVKREHWFAGDGMIHAIMISDGVLSYANKFTRTNKFISE